MDNNVAYGHLRVELSNVQLMLTHHFEWSERQQGGAGLAAGPGVPVWILPSLQDELLSGEAPALVAYPATSR